MLLRRFIIGIAIVAVAMTVICVAVAPDLRFSVAGGAADPMSELRAMFWWWPILMFFYIISPALVTWAAERKSPVAVCKEYLSFKAVNWSNAWKVLLGVAVLYPAIWMLVVALCGNMAGIGFFGKLRFEGTNEVFGLFTINYGSAGGIILLVVWSVIFGLVAGTVSGIVNNIFCEIGWRGFLMKHLSGNRWTMPVVIALIWTVWCVPFCLDAQLAFNGLFASNLLWKFLINLAMSFLLVEVIRKTGSVWVSAAVIGVTELSMGWFMMAASVTGPGFRVLEIIITLCLWGLTAKFLPDAERAD